MVLFIYTGALQNLNQQIAIRSSSRTLTRWPLDQARRLNLTVLAGRQSRHGKDKDAKGRSIALHWAALFGKFGILDKALRAGANIGCIFSTGDFLLPSSVGFLCGRTPFHQAVLAGNGAIVKYLLELNADVNKISRWSRLPIFCAISACFFF